MTYNQELVLVLTQISGSSNVSTDSVKVAEKKLNEIQQNNKNTIYMDFLHIVMDQSLNEGVRCLAAIRLKTCLETLWRWRLKQGASQEEVDKRNFIRTNMLSLASSTQSRSILKQVTQTVAKLARYDWPDHWPDLFSTLGSLITNPDPIVARNSLTCLQQVVKALASRRLSTDRKNFREMTENIFPSIYELLTQLWPSTFMGDMALPPADIQLQAVLQLMKTLHYLLNFGYCLDSVPRGHVYHQFLSFCIDQISHILSATYISRLQQSESMNIRDLFGKIAYRIAKCVANFHENFPLPFADHVPEFMTKVVGTFFNSQFDPYIHPFSTWTPERFCVKLVNTMRLVIRCRDYDIDSEQDDSKIPRQAICSFCNPDFLVHVVNRLLTCLMRLSPDDIEKWEMDPEGFVVREPLEDYEHCFRMAVELFLIALFVEFDEVIPQILQIRVANVMSITSPTEVDCLYNAVGQVALQFSQLDFTNFFEQLLIPQLKNDTNGVPELIRWRILWLFSKIPDLDYLSDECRLHLFEVLAYSMSNSSFHLSLRLQSMITLKAHIDSINMKASLLVHNLPSFISSLSDLLASVSSDDSRLIIINSLSSLIECAGKDIRQCLPGVERIFSIAWNLDTSHELLRGAVLSSLTNLVNSLEAVQEDQELILPSVVSAINVCTESTSSQKFSALLEDTLDLWFAVLSNCESTSPSCSQLFVLLPRLFDVLHRSADNLPRILDIIEAYYLLDPIFFTQNFCDQLVSAVVSLLGSVRYDMTMSILHLLDIIIVTSPQAMDRCFPIFEIIFSRTINNEDSGAILAGYITTFSRFCVSCPNHFSSFISNYASSRNSDVSMVLGQMADTWNDRFQFSAPLDRRKVMAMTLVSLLQVPVEPIYVRFSAILNIVVDIFQDLSSHSDSSKPFVDMLANSLPDVVPNSVLSDSSQSDTFILNSVVESRPHIRRKKIVKRQSDPVYAFSFDTFVLEKINLSQQALGQARFEQLLESTDADVVHQLKFQLEGRRKVVPSQ